RQLLLRDERLLAAYFAVAPGVEQLEQNEALLLERRGTAVEHDLVIADARGELAQAEREPGRERAAAQRDELRGRMHELADRASRHAAQAHAEQRLRSRVHLRDQQRLVEHDQGRGETLKYLARRGRGPRSAQSADGICGGGRRCARNVRRRGDY